MINARIGVQENLLNLNRHVQQTVDYCDDNRKTLKEVPMVEVSKLARKIEVEY